jgi:acyl carrier protein
MEKLMIILTDIRPDLDFEEETKLIDGGVLDSFDIIAITTEINDKFDININVADLKPENYNSAAAMWALIQTYLE